MNEFGLPVLGHLKICSGNFNARMPPETSRVPVRRPSAQAEGFKVNFLAAHSGDEFHEYPSLTSGKPLDHWLDQESGKAGRHRFCVS
jgi:hypothetical protein